MPEYIRKSANWQGQRYRVYGRTEAEAAVKLDKLISALKRGEIGISENMSVARWAKEWIETYVTPRIRPEGSAAAKGSLTKKSALVYQDKIYGYIIPAVGSMRLGDVRDIHLQKMLNAQTMRSYSHLSKLRMVTMALFSQARKSRLIAYDPSEDLTLPSCEKNSRRSLTDLERSMLLRVAASDKYGLWIRTLLLTGLRPGESAPLKWSDIDLDEGLLRVSRALESGSKAVKAPKTDAGVRSVPVPDPLLADLRAVKKRAAEYIFPQTDGKTMQTQTTIKAHWLTFRRLMELEAHTFLRAIAEEAEASGLHSAEELRRSMRVAAAVAEASREGFPHELLDDFLESCAENGSRAMLEYVTPHGRVLRSVFHDGLVLYTLRHTYCTDLEAAGVPIHVASYLMGHEDISTTANIYTHTPLSAIKDAARRLNRYNKKQA